MIATTRPTMSVRDPMLFVAFELGKTDWKVAVTSGLGVTPWVKTLRSGDRAGLDRLLEAARGRFGVPAGAAVVSCYEAGRDGFWVHRALTALGVQNRVVDSASIEVNRRARRAKTDRLDALKLVRMLVRVWHGEAGVWGEVRGPTVAEEAARQVSRERTALVAERTVLTNQLRSWLTLYGATLPETRSAGWWTRVPDWAGEPLPLEVQARIERAEARGAVLEVQIAALETQQQAGVRAAAPASAPQRMVQLKGVGATSTSVLLDEGLVWREFANRRQVGGWLGFAPTPYNSGESERELGISRAGNPRVQAVAVQLAWRWVRWQPASPLTQWFQTRFSRGKRQRRIGIVAVARRLLIALWRYATKGIVPPGAALKTA